MKLTILMRAALEAAARQPLRRVHDDQPGRPPWPAHPATLAALVRHELVEISEIRNRKGWPVTIWTATDKGRWALEPVEIVVADRPLYLNRWVSSGGDYTRNPQRASDDLEVVDPRELDARWGRDANGKHALAIDRRQRERRLRNMRKAA